MEIIHGLENVSCKSGAALTVGSFDGVHLGHQRILARMRESELRPVTVMTFEPHPQTILRQYGEPPPQLTTSEERAEILEELGVDRLIIARFTPEFATLPAEIFIESILLQQVGMARVFVGPTHGFGSGRRGDTRMLEEMGDRLGFGVEVVAPVVREGKPVSSSRIRKCLLAGEAQSAFHFMARPYFMPGMVVSGDGRGKAIGFPTANIKLDAAKLIPLPGIYATLTRFGDVYHPSVSHIGERPTFAGAEPSVETHIIGFTGEIYGSTIAVGLIDRIRDVKRFGSPTELAAQIAGDVEQAMIRLIASGFGAVAQLPNRRFGMIDKQQYLEI